MSRKAQKMATMTVIFWPHVHLNHDTPCLPHKGPMLCLWGILRSKRPRYIQSVHCNDSYRMHTNHFMSGCSRHLLILFPPRGPIGVSTSPPLSLTSPKTCDLCRHANIVCFMNDRFWVLIERIENKLSGQLIDLTIFFLQSTYVRDEISAAVRIFRYIRWNM